jgi:hypothetical protein
MKHTKFYLFVLITIFVLGINTSCSTHLAIETNNDSTKNTYCQITPSVTLKNMLLSLTGVTNPESLYNTVLLKQSLEKAGFSVENITVTENGSLNLLIETKKLEIPGCTVSKNNFTLLINQQTMSEVLALIPSETTSYIDLLMAPIITGEKLSSKEYEALIASMYGNTLANEMKSSMMTISFKAPTEISLATIEPSTCGTVKILANTAEYTLSLPEFLSLFSGVKFCIQWK